MNISQFIKTRLLGYSGVDSDGYFTFDWEERRRDYRYADLMYDNQAYLIDASSSQCRANLFRDLCGREMYDNAELIPHFNPVASIVDTYQHALRGSLGSEIKVELNGEPLEPALNDAIRLIWKDSRFDGKKEAYQHFAALYGCAGLQIQAVVNDAGEPTVRIVPIPPAQIIDIEESDTGAVSEVLLEYTVLTGPLGEGRESVVYRERLSKDFLQRWKVRDEKGTKVTIPNELGVCPFVLCRHRDKGRMPGQGGELGLSAYHGSDNIIHLINIRASQLGLSIDKALWAKWFIAGGSSAPTEFPFGGTKVLYAKIGQDEPTPMIQAIVEKIDAASAMKQIEWLMKTLIQRQPEMVLDNIDAVSGQSGETIAKLFTPVQSRILTARQQYEHPLIDAIRIALSWGILMKKWDLGTGMGTREAADRAYQSGAENFNFNDRPALPATSFDIVNQSNAKFSESKAGFDAARAGSGIVPVTEQIKVAGYSEEEATALAAQVEAAKEKEMSNARSNGTASSK